MRLRVTHNKSGVSRIRRDSYSNKDTQTKWWSIVKEIKARSGGRCEALIGGARCNKPSKEVHHIRPLSRGGLTVKANLIDLCLGCHDLRHNHLKRLHR